MLGTENNGPARKWQALIRETLNTLPGTSGSFHTPSPVPNPIVELNADFEGSTRERAPSLYHRRSFQSLSHSLRMMENDMSMPHSKIDHRFSVCDRDVFGHRSSDYEPNGNWDGSSDDENSPVGSLNTTDYSTVLYNGSTSIEDRDKRPAQSRFCLVASKQMVGIFLSVWIKADLRDNVHNLKVSCVGTGLMGYLGNKVHFDLPYFYEIFRPKL